ncbi:hypothetical protein [Trueperella pyogenes]
MRTVAKLGVYLQAIERHLHIFGWRLDICEIALDRATRGGSADTSKPVYDSRGLSMI